MALGTFNVTIDADQLGAGTETAASLRVQFGSGRQFVKDEAGGKFVFPHVSNSKPIAISLPYTLPLETDVDTGVSESIGYVVTVTTSAGGRVVAGPFAAKAAGWTGPLTDPTITSDFEGLVPESLAVRAEEAAADAEAAATAAQAVGSTNDGIIASRINDPGSATATALSATVGASGATTGARNPITGRFHADNFGATFDGATDDAAAINAALTAAGASGGGTVYLPAVGSLVTKVGATLVIPSKVTLELAPGVTLSRKGAFGNLIQNAAVVATGTRDSGIGIIGGPGSKIECGAANVADTGLHHIRIRRADYVTIRDLIVTSTGGKYAINLGAVTDYRVENIAFPSASSDGVHINGPAARGVIRNISGACNDDMVSLTATDYVTYNDVTGDITETLVEKIGHSGPTAAVKVTAGTGTKVDALTVRSVRQTGTGVTVSFSDDTGALNIGRALLQDIEGRIVVLTGTIDELTVRDWRHLPQASSNIGFYCYASTGRLAFDGIRQVVGASLTDCDIIRLHNGTTQHLVVNNVTQLSPYGALVTIVNSSTQLLRAEFSNLYRDGLAVGTPARAVVNAQNAGTVFPVMKVVNLEQPRTSWVADLASATEMFLSNVRSDGGGVNVRTGSSVTVQGSAKLGASAAAAGVSIRVKSLDIPIDVSKAAKNAGDMAYNTNAGLSCGVGPVVCNGTNWKHLFTGATY